MPEIVKENGELVIRTTSTGVQQVKAKFLEDSRHISHLWFQRWNTKTDHPIGEQVILYGDEISRLQEFLSGIAALEIPHDGTFNVNFRDLRLVHLPDAEARKVLESHPDLVAEFARSKITTEDVVALAYRRKELESFQILLKCKSSSEADWQEFFQKNQWIFGYGLAYVFTTSLDSGKLQETIRGASLTKVGKRPDGIMKTRAAISALCLVEIKKHNTGLLKTGTYRPGTWAPTAELSGAVAQCQENVRTAVDELGTHHRFTDQSGQFTGEDLMAVQPRSFLIIGDLNEFHGENGVNVARYRSFEDYRRNLRQPEILTFDELFERARFIVENADQAVRNDAPDNTDIPF